MIKPINPLIYEALNCLKAKLAAEFGDETEVILFGSVARGESRSGSDVDILILMPCAVNLSLEEYIMDMVFEVGLQYDLVFGILIYSTEYWQTSLAQVMPLYASISHEGIRI